MSKAGAGGVDEDVLAAGQVRTLYMQALVTNGTIFFVVALYMAVLAPLTGSPLVWVWALALSGAASLRLVLWFLYRQDPARWSLLLWRRLYLLGCAVVGAAWCIIYPLIWISGDPLVFVALAMLIFGVVGSGVAVLSIYPAAFLVYCYPQILTLIVVLLLFENPVYGYLAIGCAVYLVMTTLFVRKTGSSAIRVGEAGLRLPARGPWGMIQPF